MVLDIINTDYTATNYCYYINYYCCQPTAAAYPFNLLQTTEKDRHTHLQETFLPKCPYQYTKAKASTDGFRRTIRVLCINRLFGLARTWQNTAMKSLSNNNAHRQTSTCHKTPNARLLLIMRHQFADSDTAVHSALSIRSLRRDSPMEPCEQTDWLPRTMHFKIDGQK